jgi:cellobiose dehydrogenase (acceptor)
MLFKSSWLLALAPFAAAQGGVPVPYTDPDTGIQMGTWTTAQNSMKMGFTFPSNALSVDANEYIGLLECASPNGKGTGWCSIGFGTSMTNSMLLAAWPQGDEVYTDFKKAPGYEQPLHFGGNAKLTQISSSVNATHFRLVYRCENCIKWSGDGVSGTGSTSSGQLVNCWAHGKTNVIDGECPKDTTFVQHETQNTWGMQINEVSVHSEYSEWTKLATKAAPSQCDGAPTSTTAIPSSTSSVPVGTGTPVPTGTAYDYIVVGSGAGGIPIADKLSEAGKKVLLIEKGPPSSGRYGGKMKPTWLEGTNLTRFDVPGLCNQIWVDSTGVACSDTDQMAGCVLGGGTAVNAGLWWKPNPVDWDYNFPAGWKASDMKAATDRVFSRIGGTTTPSTDGKLYLQEGFNVVSSGLKSSGWSFVNANSSPDKKNRTYANTPYMFSGGERGGPLATYLASSTKRNNFELWTNTQVKRVVRKGGHVTGVEVENYAGNGYVGTVNLKANTGRVILAAGTFGSPKILLRSGIGPKDLLNIVKNSTDGPTMINSNQWINLPVGNNLEDHTNTDIVITHPSIVHYDFYEAWTDPIKADKDAYLSKRTGILAQAAPNIGPLFFDEVRGTDNIVRSFQYTSRVEGGPGDVPNGKAMVISQYLGRGAVSRGRMGITTGLNTVVSKYPFLIEKADSEAVIKSLETLEKTLQGVKDLEIAYPAKGTTMREHVENMLKLNNRRSNHWIGTNKIGTKDGRVGGDSVVDTNTKVYGTDNLFVVDASIFPGMVTTNPSAYIVIASEHAAQKINNLPAAQPAAKYSQCGGLEHNGAFQCASGTTCTYQNDYYWQCL